MKLGDLVVLPEKKEQPLGCDYDYEFNMRGDNCPETCQDCVHGIDKEGSEKHNQAIDQISQIEIPIAKILELVEVDVEKVEELFKKNISTYHYSEVLKFKKDLGSNKKDILKAVKK